MESVEKQQQESPRSPIASVSDSTSGSIDQTPPKRHSSNEDDHTRSSNNRDAPKFELRPSKDRGQGLFAVTDIKRGTRLIEELPLIRCDPQDDLTALCQKIYDLRSTPQGRDDMDALAIGRNHESIEWRPTIAAFLQQKTGGSEASAPAVEEMVAQLNKYFTNVVSSGLYSQYSRINHSCRPNVENLGSPHFDGHVILAIRDIAPGEELLATYIHLEEVEDDRQKRLLAWGFQCECEACDDETADSDARRVELRELIEAERRYQLRRAEAVAEDPLYRASGDDDAAALRGAERMVELCVEEELWGSPLSTA